MFYLAGMALNDYLDRAIDARERPNRPLPSGRVSPEGAVAYASTLIAIGLIALAGSSREQLVAGVILVALIILYNLLHTRTRLSVLLMGACRSMVLVTAALGFGMPSTPWPVLGPALLVLVYVAGFSLVARREAAFESPTGSDRCGHCHYPVPRTPGTCPECGRSLDPGRQGDFLAAGAANVRERFRCAPFVGPILLLSAIFVHVLPAASGPVDLRRVLLLTALFVVTGFLLAWTTAAAKLIEKRPPQVGRAITMWIAALSLADAYLALLADAGILALLCIACFLITRLAQRRIAGT
jgi:hypothetical protein